MEVFAVFASTCSLCRDFSLKFYFYFFLQSDIAIGYGSVLCLAIISLLRNLFMALELFYLLMNKIKKLFEDKYICLRIPPVFEWKDAKKH